MMKQFSQVKLKNMKAHLSQHKKIYGLAALTLVFGTLFSENVLAAADAPLDFDGGYDKYEGWIKKIVPLGLFAVGAYALIKTIAASNYIGAILSGVLMTGAIAFLKYSWAELTGMFG